MSECLHLGGKSEVQEFLILEARTVGKPEISFEIFHISV